MAITWSVLENVFLELLFFLGRIRSAPEGDPEKISPTATIDAYQSNCDVPSAYLMKICKTPSKYVCAADSSASDYLQPDETLFAQLQRALYSEAGN